MSNARRGQLSGRVAGFLAAAAVVSLAAGTVAGDARVPAAAGPGVPPVHEAVSVTGLTPVPYRPVRVSGQTSRRFTATATHWPAAGSGTAMVSAPAPGAAAGPAGRAAGTPAWVQAVAPEHGTWRGPSRLQVAVEPQRVSGALGIHGVVWTLAGLSAGAGSVRAGLSYAAFAQVYGGNYGARLTLEELPPCALSTPALARCRKQTPLHAVNDVKTSTVSAVLPLPSPGSPWSAPRSPAPVVLEASSTAGQEGGPLGTYGATSLRPSGSWAEGGASGSFTYTYPITVPGASSPLVPDVALSYDSGSVDGQTAATQAQADWAGDGWSTGDSFIEQSFTPCDDSPEGVTLPPADQTEDMCYDGNVVTLSLNGTTTALVLDDTTGKWRLQGDDGSTVTLVTGSGNGSGTYNTEYWVITKRDGTSYYFGMNHLPGWASGDPATHSVDYEPVYSSQPTDPCYSSAGFTSSLCPQPMAYRWHLDYVTDAHGDAMAYYYHQDTNYYGQDEGASNGKYVRDSFLTEIDYGFRAGGAYGTVPDKIVYGTSARCVAASCPPISASNSGTAGSDYPDVPYDLNCAAGATCTVFGPTYWSTVMLTSITTEQYSVPAGGYENVDSYALTPQEPPTGDGTSPTLWLQQITRTGDDTSADGSSSPAPPLTVSFSGTDKQNRVDTTNFPGLYRYRLTTITNEMGGTIGITYGTPDTCTASYVESMTTNAQAASNTKSCFPVWWTPADYNTPVLDWFEKYAVTQVLQDDTTGGALNDETDYCYTCAGSTGAAWHFDDNEVVQAKYRTYGQFRGYGTVTTLTGDGVNDPQTKQVTTYYRGMSDDNNTTAVTLTDSQGGSHDDADQLAGLPLETTVYDGNGGPVDHSTINSYWVSAATASRARPGSGLLPLTANMVQTAETWTRQALTDGGTTSWRYTETDTSYQTSTSADEIDELGLPTYVYTHTVPASAAYDRCTATTYAQPNTSENLAGLVASAETDSVACSGFTEGSPASVPSALNTLGAPASVTRPGQVVSATRTFYDDPSFATTFPQTAAPTAGNVTMTRQASGYSSGAFTWRTTARDTYDQYGRVLDAYDGNGNQTVTAYTVDGAGLTTAQSVTNPLGQTTAQTLDPTRGLTLTATDANGVVTTLQYDALGRVTSVWLDSRFTPVNPPPANDTYAYTVDDPTTHLSGITAKTMGEDLGYVTTVTILDSLGRTRETQTDTPQGGRLIADDFYDSRGWVYKKNNRYWDSSTTPTLSLGTPADSQVPDQDEYVFNGLGQVVQDISRDDASTVSTTTTVYNGDRTTVIPPAGGVIKSTLTDPLGRTSEIDEYTSAPTLVTPPDTFTGTWYVTGGTTTATSYGYDGHGNQSTITDSAGNTWTSVYNLLGEVTSKTDPDTGTTTMSYDGDGNLLQSTDARNDTVSWTYDALDRKTAEYAAPTASQSSSNELASWVYDNSNNVAGVTDPIGQLTTETSYSGGAAYTIQQTGFNQFGESLGQTITIPGAAGALAGTYTFSHAYNDNTGTPATDTYPSAAGLPAETVGYTYQSTPLDLPQGLGGSIDGYAQNTSYDAYGDILQETIGTGSNLAAITSTYDPHTLQLTDQLVTRHLATPADVDAETYTYDLYGNITRQVSTRLGSTATSETQCYTYNGLDQLTAAWTATDNCAAVPTPSSHATVGDALGTASEYWTTYTDDVLGDLTNQVQHNSVTGGTDTTTTNTYNGSSTGQPHTLTSSAQTGGTTSTSTFGYDRAGNMTTRDAPATGNQTLTWNAAGQLTTLASSTKGTSSYVYSPSGSLLLQKDPTAWTLYLPGEQFTLTNPGTPGATESGVRIIPLPSGGDVVRTGATTSYYFEIPDIRGTSTLYLDNTAQNPTWRQYDPYGNPRGPATAWIDNRAFLNQPADPITGLTDLGARQYDPATAQFISPDPLLMPADPQDLNPYAYAAGNPVTNTDPTGLYKEGPGGCGPSTDPCPGSPPPPSGGSGSSGDGAYDPGPCAINISACIGDYLGGDTTIGYPPPPGPGNGTLQTGPCTIDISACESYVWTRNGGHSNGFSPTNGGYARPATSPGYCNAIECNSIVGDITVRVPPPAIQTTTQNSGGGGFFGHLFGDIASFTSVASDIIGDAGAVLSVVGLPEVGETLTMISGGLGIISSISYAASGQDEKALEELGTTALTVLTGGLGRIGRFGKFVDGEAFGGLFKAFQGTAENAETFTGGSGMIRSAWAQRAWGYAGVGIVMGGTGLVQFESSP